MATPIIITIAHSLGVSEAQERITRGVDKIRSDFSAIITNVDLVWRANHADIDVVAVKQQLKAGIDVFDDNVRFEIHLPWYLSPMQEKIAALVNERGKDMLLIGKN